MKIMRCSGLGSVTVSIIGVVVLVVSLCLFYWIANKLLYYHRYRKGYMSLHVQLHNTIDSSDTDTVDQQYQNNDDDDIFAADRLIHPEDHIQ